ncbi:Major facilitator superfamily domain, general substrate transporter [Penicillium expansum]|uniref:Major facilitator superfamily domain, general substrate transporter n=1 Tax=Penicillium expansum TaxID=27334 RepID=A0A0A2K2Z9_PENEN|nr:Major facilitator superfamily domain, general substrate transporter [Penicillium expansum]KGO62059.1 Major facilitator superfamily domain, general substrate transporter [Penicillium expansum]
MPPPRTSTSDSTKSTTIDAPQSMKEYSKTTTNVSVKDEDSAIAGGSPGSPGPPENQSTLRVVCLIVSAFVAMFLVALDRTIISTAIPKITDEFNSFDDVGFVFLGSTLVFEVASAICGAAPNSVAFIIGRAICGVGAAGILAGTIMCIIHSVPLQKRPQIQGLFGALFGIASVVGPLIGGAFASNVTWRWCFYVNLPIGGAAMVFIAFCLKIPEQDTAKVSSAEKVLQLDFFGTTLLISSVVCLILALQWGGQTYAWSDGRVVVSLVLMAVLLLSFVAIQVFLPKTATLPVRIFSQRSIISGFWQTLCVGSGNYIFVYFLPIWFQSIKGSSAVESGIRLLPMMLSMVVGSIGGGITNSKIGYYTPLAIIGSCIMSVGAGLLTTFQVDTVEGKWIGYQIVYGLGLGLCFQVPNLAAQTVLPKPDVPFGLALMLFGQMIGAAVFVSVGENILANQLVKRLSGLPGFNSHLITSGGVTLLLNRIPADLHDTVLHSYNEALRKVFQAGLIISCLAVLGAATLEWKSIKKGQPNSDTENNGLGGGEKTVEAGKGK